MEPNISELLKTLFIDPEKMDWIYDTDHVTGDVFRLKEVFIDPDSGLSVIYSTYPKGYCKPAHHHTFGQGIYVLDGVMQADGRIMHKGEFVWYPTGKVGTHGATDEGDVTFLAINSGNGMPIYD